VPQTQYLLRTAQLSVRTTAPRKDRQVATIIIVRIGQRQRPPRRRRHIRRSPVGGRPFHQTTSRRRRRAILAGTGTGAGTTTATARRRGGRGGGRRGHGLFLTTSVFCVLGDAVGVVEIGILEMSNMLPSKGHPISRYVG
jgi:hypothetical protein